MWENFLMLSLIGGLVLAAAVFACVIVLFVKTFLEEPRD